MIRHSILKFAASLFAAVLTIASIAPAAHAQDVKTTVNIPFAFEVGPNHFNAGHYSIRQLGDNTIAIRGASGSALAMTIWDSKNKSSAGAKVVFHRYGTQYFLREVWPEGSANFLKCVDDRAEMKVKKEIRSQVAASVAKASTVEVALLTNSN
jgi:hypothetical protein